MTAAQLPAHQLRTDHTGLTHTPARPNGGCTPNSRGAPKWRGPMAQNYLVRSGRRS